MNKITLLFFLLLTGLSLVAQTDSALSIAWSGYQQTVGMSLRLNNGSEYLRDDHGIGGSPFFQSDTPLQGAVKYNQVWYRNCSLQYDLSKDLLVLARPVDPKAIVPPPELIQCFDIAGHHFVRIDADTSSPAFLKSGFYELLYNGKLSVLAKRQKLPQRSFSDDSRPVYKTYTDFIVRLNGQYLQVDNADDFPALVNDKATALKKFIRENRRLDRKDKEKAMIAAATYFETL